MIVKLGGALAAVVFYVLTGYAIGRRRRDKSVEADAADRANAHRR